MKPIKMTLKYPGTCRVCRTYLKAGELANWLGSGRIACLGCKDLPPSREKAPKRKAPVTYEEIEAIERGNFNELEAEGYHVSLSSSYDY